MPEVVQWRGADRGALARRAAEALSGGAVVAFPTDSVYHLAASALAPAAVARLAECGPPAVAVRGEGDALDWAPGLSAAARRLARRCWPGPLELALANGTADGGAASRLPGAVRERLCDGGELRLRSPAHEAPLLALERLAGPLVTAPVRCGEAAAVSEVLDAGGGLADLFLDDGPCTGRPLSTVVRVGSAGWSVVTPGAVPEELLRELACCTIVFVCTGNTCRSPLAEGLCKKLLAERLGCAVAELTGRGYRILSAGLAASSGGEAAGEAIAIAQELGADLTAHRSRRLTADLLAEADHLIAMTSSHLRALAPYCGAGGALAQLLSPRGEDVDDPIGGDQDVYRACARQIVECLQELLPRLQGA